MGEVAVLIPVLARPWRVEPVLASLAASVHPLGRARPVFLCSPGDDAEIAACRATEADVIVVPWEAGPGDYWKKVNRGFVRAVEDGCEWAFQGADDLRFHHGWLDQALRKARRGVCVIGTNDLGNRRVTGGWHSTHSLVHADYLECGTIDEDGKIAHESYGHWFGDDEFVQTALYRGTFVSARSAVVEHLHPEWKKAEWDDTYARGRSTVAQDQALYESRKHLWNAGRP